MNFCELFSWFLAKVNYEGNLEKFCRSNNLTFSTEGMLRCNVKSNWLTILF